MKKLDIEKVEPFATVRHEVGQLFDEYLAKVNEQFEWLDETVDEARKVFGYDFSLSGQSLKNRPKLRGIMKKHQSFGKKLSPSAGKRVSRQGAFRRSPVMASFRAMNHEEKSSETEDDEDKIRASVIVGNSKKDNAGVAEGNVGQKKLALVRAVEENIKDNGGVQKAEGDFRRTENKAEKTRLRKRKEQVVNVPRKRMARIARDEAVGRNGAENDKAVSREAVLRPRFHDGTSNPNNLNGGGTMDKKALEKQRIKREQDEMRRLETLEGKRQWKRSAPDTPELVGKKSNAEAGQAEPSTKPKYKAIFAIPVDKKIAKVVPSPRPNRNTIVLAKPKIVKPNPGGACAASSDFRPVEKGSNDDNYDISDARSSDDTDIEEHPRKKIPAWARGGQLQMRLTQNFYNPPDLDDLFGVLCMPGDMTQMFDVHRERFFKRSSSDEWDSPVRPHTNDPKK